VITTIETTTKSPNRSKFRVSRHAIHLQQPKLLKAIECFLWDAPREIKLIAEKQFLRGAQRGGTAYTMLFRINTLLVARYLGTAKRLSVFGDSAAAVVYL